MQPTPVILHVKSYGWVGLVGVTVHGVTKESETKQQAN